MRSATFFDAGEEAKQKGMEAAASRNRAKIVQCQLAFLEAILVSPDGTATIDDATADLGDQFADCGKWRGAVTRGLACRNLIEKIGRVRSRRRTRHGDEISLWRLKNRQQAERLRDQYRIALAATKNDPAVAAARSIVNKPVQLELFDDD